MNDDMLKHYGILGMKWGVRRTPEQLGKKTGSGDASTQAKNAATKKTREKRPRLKQMTDEELQARLSRLKMEAEYRKLKLERRSKPRKLIVDVLDHIGTNSIKNIGTQAATAGLGILVNKWTKRNFVNPQKGQKDK